MEANTMITIAATVNAPLEVVWRKWTTPADIMNWNAASDDWHTTHSENDLRVGGKFTSRMEAKDGSFGFDFWGIYDTVKPMELIEYTMGDGRKAKVTFAVKAGHVNITTDFEAEGTNSVDMQRTGWQAILDNFKKYAETGS